MLRVAELGCNNGGFKFAHGLPVAFRVGEHMAVPIVCHGYRCVTKYFLDPLRCPTQMRDKERSGGMPQAVKAIARLPLCID